MRTASLFILLLAAAVARADDPHAALRRLADAYWDQRAAADPEEATYYGDPRFGDRLADLSDEAAAARAAREAKLADELATIPRAALTSDERLTADLLAYLIEEERGNERYHLRWFSLSTMAGPNVDLPVLARVTHPRRDARDAETMLARWHAVPRQLDQLAENHRRGLAHGLSVPRVIVERVIAALDKQLADDPDRSPFAVAFDEVAGIPPALRAALHRAARDEVLPAFRKLRAFLHDEYLPKARTTVGAAALPDGKAIYAHLVWAHTTSRRPPEELHAMGERELSRIEGEIVKIGSRLGLGTDARTIAAAVRKDEGFPSRQAVLDGYRAAVARFEKGLPRAFGRLPKARCDVRAMPSFMEKDGGPAYYDPPPDDGSRPGVVWVNTSSPEHAPRDAVESTAAHEGVPGHHFQGALDAERKDRPRVRRYLGVDAFFEGWGLYAERLVDELGLYSDDHQRLGMLFGQAFRAARVVVDTGLHALGWSRQRAIDFLAAHTEQSREMIEVQIDRYIAWPGQALAYMVGRMEIDALRREEEQRLGPRFRLADFHDRLLSVGAMPLGAIRRAMQER